MTFRHIGMLLCVGLLGCGGGNHATDHTDGGSPPSSACLTGTACASSEKDCASGERCNTSLSPPQCETLYCGANGSVCADDINDAQNLCKSMYCSEAGVCADTPVDMAGTTPDLASDMASCGAENGSCNDNPDCCSGHCNRTLGRCAAVGCHTGGGSCSSASDCCSQECDQDGTCAYELGTACTEQEICVSGTECRSGTCGEGAACSYGGGTCLNHIGCCTPSQYFCSQGSGTCVACIHPGGLPSGAECNSNGGASCCSGSCPAGLCD